MVPHNGLFEPFLTLLEPQSRFGGKPLKLQVVYPQNGTAVLTGLTNRGGSWSWGETKFTTTGDRSKYLVGPTVHTKTHIFTYFYEQYSILFTMVPRNINTIKG